MEKTYNINNLKEKKILLLSPSFYNYEYEIIKQLKEFGAIVDYRNSDLSASSMNIIKIRKLLCMTAKPIIDKYQSNLYDSIKGKKYDYIFVICGWAITSSLCKKIRENNLADGGKMILYYWDSLDRLQDDINRWHYFDRVISFDIDDCTRHNEQLEYLPLFYCDKYWRKDQVVKDSHLAIVASFMLYRYNVIKTLKKSNENLSIKFFLRASLMKMTFHKIIHKEYRGVQLSDLAYVNMNAKEVADYLGRSCAVLDIHADKQSGLTIRTFETLASHRKLITTNKNVKKCNFYNQADIFVLENNFELPDKKWFEKEFTIDDKILEEYSLSSWLLKIFQ